MKTALTIVLFVLVHFTCVAKGKSWTECTCTCPKSNKALSSFSGTFEVIMGKSDFKPHPQNGNLCYLKEALLKISENYPCFYMEELYHREDFLK